MVGWVDDEPWLSSNFASPVCAVDESSCPIRFRSFCLTIDALSISSVPCYRQADRRIPFQREEQRRFEIIDAHWDLPVKAMDLDAKP